MTNYERLMKCSFEEFYRFFITHSVKCYRCKYATIDDRCTAPRHQGIGNSCDSGFKEWLSQEQSEEDFWKIRG